MSYQYRHVNAVRVIDGDTVRLDVDMGNNTWWTENFRLNGIDTPEKGAAGYAEATEHLASLIRNGVARIETFKPDKYGRYLVDIWIHVDNGELLVNRLMVLDGYAKEYFGGRK